MLSASFTGRRRIMSKFSNLLGDHEFNRKLKKLMIPIALQSLLLNAVSLGDTFILGAVSQEALAAVSLASQVFFVLSLFMFTLVGGTTILAAQYLGKNDQRTVSQMWLHNELQQNQILLV